MPKHYTLFLFAVFFTACALPAASPQWHHPDNPDSLQMQRALGDCRMYLDAAQESGTSPPHRKVQEWDDEFVQCMVERGWTPTRGPR